MFGQPQERGVHVARYTPEWEDLAWGVVKRLGAKDPSPGRPDKIVERMIELLKRESAEGVTFMNPIATVTAPEATQLFWQTSWGVRILWWKAMKRVFGSLRRAGNFSHELKGLGLTARERKKVHALVKQLAFTGVVINQGKCVHPSQWPPLATASATHE